MLTVHTAISSVEGEIRNGKSHKRYHGNTTGANRRDAAIGQANTFGDNSYALARSQLAVSNPTSTATAARIWGGAKCANMANSGPLKRNPCTYVPNEPIGMCP